MLDACSPAHAAGPPRQMPPRAEGELRLSARLSGGRSRIDDLRQAGSLRALFPRPHGAALDAVFLNTAGGLTGGDRMRIEARAEAGARIVISSQAAERGYRAEAGEGARIEVGLAVEAGGRIDWLPQETILFDGAAIARRMSVTLAPGAVALLAEAVILGRTAMGEEVGVLRFRDRWEVRRDGRLQFVEALDMTGDAAALMGRPGIGGGARALATVVFAAPGAEGQLDELRSLLPVTAGVSAVAEDLVVLRMLAGDGFEMRRGLVPVLEHLAGGPLPKVWRL
ncbi:MAG: urease accessory protein UreD [Rubellimicrobium sp.]|nr:urease accessory protein UreD [Rubellimicrobium sp.]